MRLSAIYKYVIDRCQGRIRFFHWYTIAVVLSMPNVAAAQPRIVSTDAGTTDILIALGQAQHIVGVDVTSTVPDEIKPAQVGYHRALSAEGILSLRPSVVFGGEHLGPKEVIHALKQANITLHQKPTAKNTQDLISNIKGIAKSLDLSSDALVTDIQNLESQLQLTRKTNVKHSAVFLLDIGGRGIRQAGAKTTGDAFINLLGVTNVAGFDNYRSVSVEAMILLQPDLILVGGESQKVVDRLLQQFPALAHTPAGKQNKIIYVNAKALVSGISPNAVREASRVTKQYLLTQQ